MLNSVAHLPKDIFRHIGRILRNEKHRNTFGADQAPNLFYLVNQDLGGIIKQQVCLIKEKGEDWVCRGLQSQAGFQTVPTATTAGILYKVVVKASTYQPPKH